MILKRFAVLAFIVCGALAPTLAAGQVVSSRQAVCDPKFPANCIKPNADGSVPIGASGGGAVTITGTVNLGTAAQGSLDSIDAAVNTPAATLPPPGPVSAADTTLTYGIANITTSGDTTLVSATASQTTRLHSLYCTIDGATVVTLKSATTAISATFRFPASGGFINWAYGPYWRVKTAANEALVFNSSAAVNANCNFTYVKGS